MDEAMLDERVDDGASLDEAEAQALRDGLSRALARIAGVGRDEMAAWRETAAFGLAGLGESAGDVVALRIAMEELGAAGMAAPLVGAAVAHRLLAGTAAAEMLASLAAGDATIAVAFGPLDGDRLAGAARLEADLLHGSVAAVEDAGAASHLLVVLDASRACLLPRRAPYVQVELTDGYASPPLARVTFDGAACDCVALPDQAAEDAVDLARQLVIARAWGAARRALALAVEHSVTREQFGRPIGRFQAIGHKLADCRVALDLAEGLLDDACAATLAGVDAARAVATLVSAASPALRRLTLEVQHVLGAVGFAAEHEAARLFLRVHADTARLGGVRRARRLLRQWLRDPAVPVIAEPREPEALARQRRAFRDWVRRHWNDEIARDQARDRDADPAFLCALRDAGWLTANWPVEAGGAGLNALEQVALLEELRGAGAPMTLISPTHWVVGPAIAAYGSVALKERVLPEVAAGRMSFALGYSEPQAGSDLAALATTARRHGNAYLVNGQKIWTSNTEHATHLLLAVRTGGAGERKQDGISLLIVPTDAAGVTVRRMATLHGKTFASVFLDDVRVPADMLVGGEGQGWRVLTAALGAERVIMGGQVASLRRLFAGVVRTMRSRDEADAAAWDRLAERAAELDGARTLARRAVERVGRGEAAVLEGAVAKLYGGDLAERLGETVLDLCGLEATLAREAADALLDGEAAQQLRTAIMMVVGGGTAEIQRTIIHRQLG